MVVVGVRLFQWNRGHRMALGVGVRVSNWSCGVRGHGEWRLGVQP